MIMSNALRLFVSIAVYLLLPRAGAGQALYFPPLAGETWETVDPAGLGWCTDGIDDLYDLLEENNTKAFIVLKGGKIALEKYFGAFTADSIWYWASAGKTLTGFLTGMAQEQGFLSIHDTTSQYLGAGWTSCDPADELKRTIWHQLTMTTAFDDSGDAFCTLPECLECIAEPGTRWAYHNGPYTLLDDVLEEATGQNLNLFIQQQLRTKTGINGLFIRTGDNNIFYSRPRMMARFGLLLQADGIWDGETVLGDTAYLNAMRRSSQALNTSYGYLTWLNGQESYMLPGLQFVFPGSVMPDGPDDMYMALGKNGQYINVAPSLDLVLIRMGNAPANDLVPVLLNNQIWQRMNDILCAATSTGPDQAESPALLAVRMHGSTLHVTWGGDDVAVALYDLSGRQAMPMVRGNRELQIRVPPALEGLYVLEATGRVDGRQRREVRKLVICKN
jgi:CubicO group peptidase (beta-lactamase class C family)